MLNEKKIEEAARKRLYAFRKDNPDGYSSSIIDIESDCLDNFKAGAHWAIQEFLKDLWHDASEEPKCKDKGILIRHEVLDNMAIGDYHIEYDSFILGNVFENQDDWEEFKDTGYDCVESWLYLDDLLPKQKGGEE